VGGLGPGSYTGLKLAVAVIIFHFVVKMLVQFADILLPFIMALLLVTVLEPVKRVTHEVLVCTMVFVFTNLSCCSCCLRAPRKRPIASDAADPQQRAKRQHLHELVERFLLFVSILLTVLLAGRAFWLVGRIVWLSGEAVIHDFTYYHSGTKKRGDQVEELLNRFHLEKKASFDTEDLASLSLSLLKYVAEFLTSHVFYTFSRVILTTIFVLFLLYSPVQRDFSPVTKGVFDSMEVYLKLKTIISLTMGITNGIALAIIGVEMPAAWALLTFLANFIPNVGGPAVSLLPCLITLLDIRKSLYQVAAAFFAQFFLHFNIANFVEPIVFGTSEEIHSVVVLLGLSFFGYIWGFSGMFLSVPLMFALHAWLDTVTRTTTYPVEAREDARFIMGMLEGRWLVDSQGESGEELGGGISLLTGRIEALDGAETPTAGRGDRSPSPGSHGRGAGHEAGVPGAQPQGRAENTCVPPIGSWWIISELRSIFAVRDARTGEVRWQGLLLRWIVLAGAYTMMFFGFAIFHWDLSILIHPSGGPSKMMAQVTSTAAATTTAYLPTGTTGAETDVVSPNAELAGTMATAAAATASRVAPILHMNISGGALLHSQRSTTARAPSLRTRGAMDAPAR